MTTISDHLYLVTKPSNPIWGNTTPWKARVKYRSAYFRAMFHADFSRTWSARNRISDGVVRHWYAGWYAPLVRIAEGAAAASSHLWFAPSYANLVRTQPAATRLVTTESYQCEQLPGAGFHCGLQGFAVVSTGNLARSRQNPRRARSAPALSVEFNSPCRSQHAGAGIYFDHTLTECETGVRRNPGRAGVRGLSHTGAVKQGGLAVSHPRQTPDEILDRLWTDRGATMRQRLAGRPYL